MSIDKQTVWFLINKFSRKAAERNPTMKHGDLEFHNLIHAEIDSIANEGLRIARLNKWRGLVIKIAILGLKHGTELGKIRCTLTNATNTAEVDEPSVAMLDAARRLQKLFINVGSPLAGATIEWVKSAKNDGKIDRNCGFRYFIGSHLQAPAS